MDGADDLPARGLKGMLSRSRKPREESTPDRTDSPGSRGYSSESGPDKFKPRPRTDNEPTEQGGDGEANRSRRKSNKYGSTSQAAREMEAGTGRGGKDPSNLQAPTAKTKLPGSDGGGSANGSVQDGMGGSTMTSDSDDERYNMTSNRPAIPPFSHHDSHTGYLTSSSPQVQAAPVRPPPDVPAEVVQSTIGKLAGESTLSVNSVDSGRSTKSRSRSPGARIRETFRPGSKKSTEFNDASKSTSALTELSGQEQSETIAARRISRAKVDGAASPPKIQTYNTAANQSKSSLPSIVMTPETPPPLPNGVYEKFKASPEKQAPMVSSPGLIEDQEATEAVPPGTRQSNATDPGASKPDNFSSIPYAHRRARSDSQTGPPSRLSHALNPPLTPMIEEVKTPPSSRNVSTASGGGFFTSMFSAAQTAANTLTTTLTNTGSRPRSSASQSQLSDDGKSRENPDPEEPMLSIEEPEAEDGAPVKPLAISTIGSGELSLSHLGIAAEAPSVPGSTRAPSTPADPVHSRSRSGTILRREEAAAREEGISAARAVSAAYSEKLEDVVTPMVEDVADEPKISALIESGIGGRVTPNGSIAEGESGVLRSSSLKNKIGSKRRRRGGSQSTIGAAIAASGSSLVNANISSAQRLAGFAVASKKRNRDFHALFRSVPEDDYLIEDYSCALQRDIILAGRIYISEGHICFSSNILGWVTTLVISFDEVVSVEKESTAMVFPNAIAVQTLHARHTFRSLLSREATYDLLIGIWKINHPGLMSSENGVRVASGTGSKTEKLEPNGSDGESEGFDDSDVDDEDGSGGSDDGQGSSVASGEAVAPTPEVTNSPPKSAIPRKASNLGVAAGQANAPPTVSETKAAAQANGAAIATGGDFPGPATHAPSECSDQSTHYATILKDEVIPAPLGKIYALVFGNASGGFMSRWLLDEVKVTDLQMEDDKKGLSDENKTRSFSYIKPLGGSIGPKQTKCIISEQLDAFDLEKAASVTVTTQTPDVPSGNVFSVKTRYCLMWGPNNGTRMIMTCVIEWTGKSWLKGPIEKGANDGQTQYANDLFKALRAAVSKGKPAAAGTPGKKKSRKKKPGEAEKSTTSLAASTESKKADWGVLEPLRGILGPIASLLQPLLTLQAVAGILTILVLYSFFIRGPSSGPALASGFPRTGRSARMAAYEELWRSEEKALWSWLEQRVGGPEGITIPVGKGSATKVGANADRGKVAKHERQQVLRGMEAGAMSEREVLRAVEITEEKLRVLKAAVGKKGNAVADSEGKPEP